MTLQKNTPPQQPHVPVLFDAVLDALQPKNGESYLDLTAGYGGHASAIIDKTAAPEKAVLVDQDSNAVAHLQKKYTGTGVTIRHEDYGTAVADLKRMGQEFDMILMDLGVSSPQFDIASRGFSLQHNGPLDMRMDNRSQRTADELVNKLSERELMNLLVRYGEEPKARRIASAIVRSRPIHTTLELANVVSSANGRRTWSKTHPATRTFQALRIAVNDELGQLESTLKLLPDLLSSGGRLAIISFHSLEDRRVKQFLREFAGLTYDAKLQELTKRPIAGTDDVHNPRARSAKLRAAVKK